LLRFVCFSFLFILTTINHVKPDLEKRICNLNYDIFLLIYQQKRFFVFYFQPQNQQTAIIFMVHFIWNYGMLYKKENQIQKECIV